MHIFKPGFTKFLLTLFACCAFSQIPALAQHFTTVKTKEGIEISENGKKILFYQQKPKSLNGKYERAGYVHPLYSLNEKILTEDFPEDHPYHRGIFWTWHQIVLNDKMIGDGWTCENVSWRPVKVKARTNKNAAVLQTDVMWESVLEGNRQTPIITEHTEITIHKLDSQYRIIDFDIYLAALVDSLKIGGSDDPKGYGGFCFRLKLPTDMSFTSGSQTITPTETPVMAGPWMNINASFEGVSNPKTGVTVFRGEPGTGNEQPWILRKETSMQNVPYPGRTPVLLTRKGLRLKYRMIIHDGTLSAEQLDKLYQAYIAE